MFLRRASVAPFFPALTICLLTVGLIACGGRDPAPGSASAEPDAGSGAPAGPPPAWVVAAMAQPRGLLLHEAGTAPGYLIVAPLKTGDIYLVDRDGRAVHSWRRVEAGIADQLLADGSILRGALMADPPNFKAGGVAGVIERISWDGDLMWRWTMASRERILHHDMEPLPNGNVLLIAWELKTLEQAVAAGRKAELVPEQGLWSEWLLEVEPVGKDDARIVWEWHLWDHLVQDHDSALANYGDPAAFPGRLDINADVIQAVNDEEELARLKALGYIPQDATQADLQSDFLHMNSVDYHAGLDQIAVSLPSISELWILDHSTTTVQAKGSAGGRSGKGGEILYRWGNPRMMKRGSDAAPQLFQQHQVEWIPAGFPGAGHLTVFNNGALRPNGQYSSVLEIETPVAADGRYPLPATGPWPPANPKWSYTAPDRESFFAPFISGTQRLPNGNTLICAGPQGHVFEVTPDGKTVWDYRNPYGGRAPGWMPEEAELLPYPLFRARWISPDHPGLARRDLRPLDPQPEVFQPPPPPG